MAWLFKSDWVTNPRNPTNADLDHLAADQRTWGGNVDAAGYQLNNVSQLTSTNASWVQGVFSSTGANSAGILIDCQTAGQWSMVYLADAGMTKYQFGKNSAGMFFLYDAVGARNALYIYPNSNMSLMPDGGKVGIGTTNPGAKLSISLGADDGNDYGRGIQIVNASGNRQQMAFIRSGYCIVSMGYFGASQTWGIGPGQSTDSSFTPSYLAIDSSNNWVGVGTATPLGALQVHAGTDKNFLLRGPITEASGVSLFSVNDANNAMLPLELAASSIYISCKTGIGTLSPWAKLSMYHNTTSPSTTWLADCALAFHDNTSQLTAGAASSPASGTWLQSKNSSPSVAPLWLNPLGGAVIQSIPTSFSDAVLNNGNLGVWYDESNNRLAYRVKSSAGVLKTGYLSVS